MMMEAGVEVRMSSGGRSMGSGEEEQELRRDRSHGGGRVMVRESMGRGAGRRSGWQQAGRREAGVRRSSEAVVMSGAGRCRGEGEASSRIDDGERQ